MVTYNGRNFQLLLSLLKAWSRVRGQRRRFYSCLPAARSIHGGMDVRTVDDVIAIEPKFLASMGCYVFLSMVLRERGSPPIPSSILDNSVFSCNKVVHCVTLSFSFFVLSFNSFRGLKNLTRIFFQNFHLKYYFSLSVASFLSK